jgi:hypothetical protein
MKKILILCIVTIFATIHTQAQLFNKLKEKAAKALEPKKKAEPTKASEEKQEATEKAPTSAKKAKVKWQPTSDCSKLFTLENGETFLYDETKVVSVNGKLTTYFVVSNKKYEYFLIEDGKRTGPFNEAPVKQMNIVSDKRNSEEYADGNSDDDDKIEMGGDKKDPVAQQYCKTISNKLYIVFNGKNFGPYDFVGKMKVSPDKKKFWASVVIGGLSEMTAKMGIGNSFLVNEAGVKQKVGDQNSMAMKMMISPSFSAAALSIMDNAGQKVMTISSTGKMQEGSIADLYSGGKSTMSIANNGDIISVPSQSPTQLMVNGNEAASFKVPVVYMSRLFLMSDYKKSVYYSKGKLYRGDGSEESLSGVTFPKFVSENNQATICYYKIHETENGDKDVYLCKKIL